MELIDRIQNGDEVAKNTLLIKYTYYAKSLAHDLSCYFEHANLLVDDLVSIGLEQVIIALKYYDGVNSFYPYWYTITEREMKKLLKRSFKHLTSISLDTTVSDGGLSLHDVMTSEIEHTKSTSLYDTFIDIVEDRSNDFSKDERFVINQYLLGYSILEIAEMMKCSRSRVYYTYRNAVNKIRSIMTAHK